MQMTTYLQNLIEEQCNTPEFIAEYAILDLTADIVRAMEERGWNRTELARQADLDPAQITRLLRNGHNVTIRTLGKIAAALGQRLHISLKAETSAISRSDKMIEPSIDPQGVEKAGDLKLPEPRNKMVAKKTPQKTITRSARKPTVQTQSLKKQNPALHKH